MSIFIVLSIVALALLLVLMVAAASSYSIPIRQVNNTQSTSNPTTKAIT